MADADSITYTLSGSDFDLIQGKLHSLFIVLQGLRKFRDEGNSIEDIDVKVAVDAYQSLHNDIVESIEERAL